jgi:hypothetical protein
MYVHVYVDVVDSSPDLEAHGLEHATGGLGADERPIHREIGLLERPLSREISHWPESQ